MALAFKRKKNKKNWREGPKGHGAHPHPTRSDESKWQPYPLPRAIPYLVKS